MDVVSNITLYTDGPSIPSKLVDIPEFEHEAFRAVRQCRIDLVEECLNNGFDVNTKHEGESLLWFWESICLELEVDWIYSPRAKAIYDDFDNNIVLLEGK